MALSLPASLDPATLRHEWFGNVRRDLLAGVVVALALIPEAIAFSIIAGVDPKVGLYASFVIAVTTSFVGGRPGMISAATGAMALLMITLVRDHGLEYLFAATILTGVIQFAFGAFRLGRAMKFVPKAVMTGFVNALAILIFMAQLPQFAGQGPLMFAFVAAGLAIIYGLPRLTTAVPSPLVAIVLLTAVSLFLGERGLNTVGDMGELPTVMPFFSLPSVPLSWETLSIIFPVSFALALVGLIESLLTAQIVDERTDTDSNKNREARGQGIANVASGLFGGMAGCAMIGQSVINVASGGRGRLSTFSAGVFLLVFILVLSDWLVLIPMGALVAVMVMVSIGTFDWRSIPALVKAPKSESFVMLVTVAAVVITHDLSIGVLAGVVLSALFFARQVADHAAMEVEETHGAEGRTHTYAVTGSLFFVTVQGFLATFDFQEDVDRVVIDLSRAHVWDGSAVDAIDRAVLRFRRRGVEVEVVGITADSRPIVDRMSIADDPKAAALVGAH